jgi:hypothetical protein
MDIQALKQELTDQSETYAGMTPAEIAAKLNLADSVVQGPLPIAQMLIWSAQTGAIKRFKAWVAADVEPLATCVRWLPLGSDWRTCFFLEVWMHSQPKTDPPPRVTLQIHDVAMAAQNGLTPRPPQPRVILQIQDSIVQRGVKTDEQVGK